MTGHPVGPRGTRSEDLRRGNLATLLTYVHVHGRTPRSELTTALGLNRSTIGGLTGELVGAGLVREEAGRVRGNTGATSGGRPSHVVVPESGRVQVLAIDIGVIDLTIARVGLGGCVLSRRQRQYRRGSPRARDVVRTIASVAADLHGELGEGTIVLGAGVAVPGVVRRTDGQIRQAPNLDWRDVPLGVALSDALGLPVSVGNDADLGIRAEHVRGAAGGVSDAIYLLGHAGIGAGIIAGGRPLGGASGYSGEVGHMVIDPDGLPCHCGSRGCWETECGEERLLALAGRPAGGGLTGVRELAAAALDGDAAAQVALVHVATWLGRGTANVVNALNPEMIILGGVLKVVLAAAGPHVHAAFVSSTLAPLQERVRIVAPGLGADSTLLGAAELAFEPLLADPLGALCRVTPQPDEAERELLAAGPPG